jgi:hypothetical protein
MYVSVRKVSVMTEHDHELLQIATERFERRLAEENAKLRIQMTEGFGSLRAEMIDRNSGLLKWALIFGATQTGALAAVIVALR